MKNILLFYASSSGESAANALASLLDPQEYNVEICSEFSSTLGYKIHHATSKSPFLWSLFWHVSNNSYVASLINKRISKAFEQYASTLDKYIPDFVLSLHPLMNAVAKQVAVRQNVPSAGFIIEPFRVHALNTSAGLDRYLAPFQELKDTLIKKDSSLPIDVLTYPVKKGYISSEGFDAKIIFSKYNLPEQYTILFSAGRFGQVKPRYIKMLLKDLPSSVNLVVLCGNDKKAQEKISHMSQVKDMANVVVLGSVEQCSDIFHIADIHFTTSGTSSFFQSLATETVLYIYDKRNERETGIAREVIAKDLGRVGKLKDLKQDIILPDDKLKFFRDNGISFMRSIHVYTEQKIFTDFFDSVFKR